MKSFRKIPRPDSTEYPAYSSIYMDLLKNDENILEHLYQNFYKIKRFIYSVDEAMLTYRYAPGKWTIKEILMHLVDDERIFTYRALRYARNDSTRLHGFEQNDYVPYSGANERSLGSIFEEYEAVRKSTIFLFQYLPEESLTRCGSIIDADGATVNTRSVRALVYHIAGHELRHMKIIKERYLNMKVGDEVI
jgi:uncharacterized damage-inducible protein DinB